MDKRAAAVVLVPLEKTAAAVIVAATLANLRANLAYCVNGSTLMAQLDPRTTPQSFFLAVWFPVDDRRAVAAAGTTIHDKDEETLTAACSLLCFNR